MPTVEKMKETGALVNVSAAEKILSKTEPVESVLIDDETSIKFTVQEDWNKDIESRSELAAVPLYVTIDGTQYKASKAAAFAFGSLYGIQNTYSRNLPGELYEKLLNHHYEVPSKPRSALIVNGVVHSLIRPRMSVYSNLDLLSATLDGIKKTFGDDTAVLADRRSFNTLTQTDIRLVIPEVEFTVEDHGMLDVPEGEEDVWSLGMHLRNSVSGQKTTALHPYLFRFWSASGITVEDEELGYWHRAHDSIKDVYDWARATTENELNYTGELMDRVRKLTKIDAEGRIGQIINDTLKSQHVGVALRREIADTTLDYDDVSVYTLLNAISTAANRPGLNQDYINRLMTGAGNLIQGKVMSDKLTTWEEGHKAPSGAPNPYKIG